MQPKASGITGVILAVALAALAGPPSSATGQPKVNEYGAAVKAFRERADAYLAQHREIAQGCLR